MKSIGASCLVAFVVIAASATSRPLMADHRSTVVNTRKGGTRTDTIAVPDMQCTSCEKIIKGALMKLRGIVTVRADAEANRVVVTYDSRRIQRRRIEQAIAQAGYDAGSARTTPARQQELPMCCRPGAHDG